MCRSLMVLLLMSLFLLISDAMAKDIEEETISVGASSNMIFNLTDDTSGPASGNSRDLAVSTEIGYFLIQNLEIGAGMSFQFGKTHDYDYHSYSLLPYFGYHWSLNDRSNILTRIGGGYGFGKANHGGFYDRDLDQSLLYALIGYEYFVNANVSLGLSIKGSQTRVENKIIVEGGYEIKRVATSNMLSTELKFNLYF